MRIALDLDGVIVNFTKAACKVMGEPYPSQHVFQNYSWLFDKYGNPSCYKRMRGHHFWTEMEKYSWADELVNLVEKESEGNWIFLTKPMKDPFCYSGKGEWIDKHFSKYGNKLVITAAPKHHFVRNKFDVLIDDKLQNIAEWNEKGGSGFFWEEVSDDFEEIAIRSKIDALKLHIKEIKS